MFLTYKKLGVIFSKKSSFLKCKYDLYVYIIFDKVLKYVANNLTKKKLKSVY